MCYIVTCMFLFWFEIWLSHSISLWSVFFTSVEKVSCVCTWTIPYADWQVLSLWLLPASGWSMVCEPGAVSEWESERMGKERQHIRVSVIPMWENIDQSHVALFMRFLQIQMAQHRQSISSQRKITREFSCNKKCILIQKWKDEILAECRVLAVRTECVWFSLSNMMLVIKSVLRCGLLLEIHEKSIQPAY